MLESPDKVETGTVPKEEEEEEDQDEFQEHDKAVTSDSWLRQPTPPDLARKWAAHVLLFNLYGLTEGTVYQALDRIGPDGRGQGLQALPNVSLSLRSRGGPTLQSRGGPVSELQSRSGPVLQSRDEPALQSRGGPEPQSRGGPTFQ
ncbi:hypothetical protein T484DRAFT_1888341, partial [Baffinella frigidus]